VNERSVVMERNYFREGYDAWYEGDRYRPNDAEAYDEFMRGMAAACEEEYKHRLEIDQYADHY